MTIDVQLAQSSKKKHRKDRKGSDDQTRGDPSVTEREERRKKRKERKKEREGASDGALSSSIVFAERLTRVPLYAHTVVEVQSDKGKQSTVILADEPGACRAHP